MTKGYIALAAATAIFTSSDGAAELPTQCTEDAMIVFDASGSMVENGGASVSRIDEARQALARPWAVRWFLKTERVVRHFSKLGKRKVMSLPPRRSVVRLAAIGSAVLIGCTFASRAEEKTIQPC